MRSHETQSPRQPRWRVDAPLESVRPLSLVPRRASGHGAGEPFWWPGHPAIAVPAAPDANGLPIGYQLIGDLGSERILLQLAAEVEAMGPGWRWPEFALG